MQKPKVSSKKAAPAKRSDAASRKGTQPVLAEPPQPESEAIQQVRTVKLKHKVVRDSFTIPKSEYAVLEALKARAADLKQPAKKSEVLRAGITALLEMNDKAFLSALHAVPVLKTGRPKRA